MKISVIMPSYLFPYRRAARNRDIKILRAINSVVNQTFTDWELIVIADGCEKTIEILTDYINNHVETQDKIRLFYVNHDRQWSGKPRNTGISNATGDIICYLDIDDTLHPDHLQFIHESFEDNPTAEWIYFDDLHPLNGVWKVNHCSISHIGYCGTSNIAHKVRVQWPKVAHYGTDDWGIIQSLRAHVGVYTHTGGYQVCHYPGKFDI